MPRITEQGKIREKRGTGVGADYIPWIKIREVNSIGTASTITDYKTGRKVQLLSQAEVYYYYLLRWDDTVGDIREQFPLELSRTVSIADRLGFRHPKDRSTHMTTDLLVTRTNGQLEAYSIKNDRSVLDNKRTLEKLFIEKSYWESCGVPFHMCYKSDVNRVLVQNIMDVVSCYRRESVQDLPSLIRYKIAHGEIVTDMRKERLDYRGLSTQYQISLNIQSQLSHCTQVADERKAKRI